MSPDLPPLPRFTGEVELRGSFLPRPRVSHVVFDFDGTLSWIRHGWPQLMIEIFRQHFPASGSELASAEKLFVDIALGMAGKPTIVQMMRFAEVVREHGGPALEPEALRREYQNRLDAEIAVRAAEIRSGRATRDEFVVFGARPFLEKLRGLGLTLMILSTTTESRVKEEAELLQIAHFFGDRIHGSGADPAAFSKRAVFERILSEEGIQGANLLSFGDGPVEIADTKALGGLTIGVCSDEGHNGSGKCDPHKRQQLLAAGADAAVPDYRDAALLFDYLLAR